jgi:catechol 2,3-dioxygenase-like lactoylglutathione lyase family enzyme
MDEPVARLTLVTICVRDLARSTAFYEALGFRRKARAAPGVAFFDAGGVVLSLWSATEMAKDAGIEIHESSGYRAMSLAWNCASPVEVDRALARAKAAGAKILREAGKVFWGGYTAYFTDPDGHIWEIAHNPGWPLSADGRLMLPD